MNHPQPLQPGDELRCPHCSSWHVVIQTYREGTDYTRQMLMWGCKGGSYYAGQIGGTSRHQTRRPGQAA
jgi:hypothetical protein